MFLVLVTYPSQDDRHVVTKPALTIPKYELTLILSSRMEARIFDGDPIKG
jgi:hypothetical protein